MGFEKKSREETVEDFHAYLDVVLRDIPYGKLEIDIEDGLPKEMITIIRSKRMDLKRK